MSFVSESISTGFGVDGVTIEQTLLNTFDPYSGIDINTGTFQNTNQGLEDSNQDGRIELGMFSFDDDNLASNNFPSVLGSPFIGITKTNMVNNGDCKFVEKSYYEENEIPIIVKPEGEWKFLSLLQYKEGYSDLDFENSDEQGFLPYGGRYNYVPLSLEQDGDAGLSYWENIKSFYGNYTIPEIYGTDEDFQEQINTTLESGVDLSALTQYKKLKILDAKEVPSIAAWLVTPEAYSNNMCLCFMNFQIWDGSRVVDYTNQNTDDYSDGYVFNWLAKTEAQSDGVITTDGNIPESMVNTENQYRVLNQVQKIYDKFNDEPINPYSSLKIRFKMKTTHVLPPGNSIDNSEDKTLFVEENPLDESLGFAPQVEVGILGSQFEETPKTGKRGLPFAAGTDFNLDPIRLLDGNEYFKAPGSWNSQRYYNGDSFEEKNYSEIGGMNRFQNSTLNEWETFEFTYNLSMEHDNRGEIYGVKYGGTFDDEENRGPVEIMINNRADGNGLPNDDSDEGGGEIYFKVPGYQDDNTAIPGSRFYIIPPDGVSISGGSESVFVRHGDRDSIGYMTVWSSLGEGQTTGLQSDGRFIEAYLMYIGPMNLIIDDNANLGYGQPGDNPSTDDVEETDYPTTPQTDMVVAYWDGERWTYDDNTGYDRDNEFNPNSYCFIIARLYASPNAEDVGISGMDQYISNESQFPTDGVGNLSLFLQSGNNFNGRVLIDDIECFESYEFTPEVDVRKKKSIGNYGLADLTKYYDKELHPIQYKDSQGPLEAQFYFYPQYPTNKTFVERTPIYQDFRGGRFYIYDVDWGDGTPNEFTSKLEQIDENTALYHTYETYGIFEVTGTMIRVKTDRDDKINGVAYNKKFKLRININEGNDEDFQYFGSDGYSFIPFKETIPIIGGISKQSNYYKTIKRQLGFLNNEKINIEFKNKSDKLKTELALLKMENQDIENLEVLPNYLTSRTEIIDKLLYPGTPDTFNDGGQNFDYNQKNGPFYWNTDELEINTENIPREIIKIIKLTYVDVDTVYKVTATYDTVAEEWTGGWSTPSTLLYENSVFFIFELDSEMVDSDGFYWEALQFLNQDPIIYNGISPIKEELGKSIGDCDLTNIKYYNEPKSIWELFGFEEYDFNKVGNPNDERYWKNIIPKGYSIFNRDGITGDWLVNPVAQGGTNNRGSWTFSIIDEEGNEQTVNTGITLPMESIEPTPIKIAYIKTADKRYDVVYESISDNFESIIIPYRNIRWHVEMHSLGPTHGLAPTLGQLSDFTNGMSICTLSGFSGTSQDNWPPNPTGFYMGANTTFNQYLQFNLPALEQRPGFFMIDSNYSTIPGQMSSMQFFDLLSNSDYQDNNPEIGPSSNPFVYGNNGLPPQFNSTGEKIFRKMFTLDFNNVDVEPQLLDLDLPLGINGNPGGNLNESDYYNSAMVMKMGEFTNGESDPIGWDDTSNFHQTAHILGVFDLSAGEGENIYSTDEDGEYFIDYDSIYDPDSDDGSGGDGSNDDDGTGDGSNNDGTGDGSNNDGTGDGFSIDTYSEQEWLDGYYYPVLPRYGADGIFIEGDFPKTMLYESFLPQHLATLPFPQYKEEFNADGNEILNAFDATTWGRLEDGLVRPDISDLIAKLSVGAPPSPDYIYPAYVDNWSNLDSIPSGNGSELSVTSFRNIGLPNIPFTLEGSITDENDSDKNLLINIVNEKNDVEVFNDKSGNKNYGFSIEDFSPKYDEKTLRVKKNKSKSILKTSKPNGAF